MVKIRKFAAYQGLKRPYTRVSKYSKKNFVRGGYPNLKVTRFDMGDPRKEYDTTLKLVVSRSMNIRHNAMEAARMSSNRLLEKNLGSSYHLRLKVYPFHVLRENPIASGAGADRISTGMTLSYGKPVGAAARMRMDQTIFELKLNKVNIKLGKEALERASKKLPCTCRILTE
ncbi:50S ribosomal protein L16 [Candidatus Woesearchaeota archaeon]|nr:50S ribosomal protein L16 [Candidatus Woesearchaeota archaeon]